MKADVWDFPSSPAARTSHFHCRGTVQSLVEELRSCKSRTAAKKVGVEWSMVSAQEVTIWTIEQDTESTSTPNCRWILRNEGHDMRGPRGKSCNKGGRKTPGRKLRCFLYCQKASPSGWRKKYQKQKFKTLEENTSEYLCDLRTGKNFLNKTFKNLNHIKEKIDCIWVH